MDRGRVVGGSGYRAPIHPFNSAKTTLVLASLLCNLHDSQENIGAKDEERKRKADNSSVTVADEERKRKANNSSVAVAKTRAKDEERKRKQTILPLSLPELPIEVMEEILSRLPVKPLMRFRCVCKRWKELVDDPRFKKMHSKRALEINNLSSLILVSDQTLYYVPNIDEQKMAKSIKLDLSDKITSNEITVVGSCNGLIWFSNTMYREDDDIYLWNPATREYKELPYAPLKLVKPRFQRTVMGFGYNPTRDEYKVVRIVYSYLSRNHWDTNVFQSQVCVYTLGTNSWKSLEGIQCRIFTRKAARVTGASQMALVNGTLHWMARNAGVDESRLIISFDMGDEKFKEVSLPDIQDDSSFPLQVAALGGCLSLVCGYSSRQELHIWVMKDYGVKQSWIKRFSVRQPDIVRQPYTASFRQTSLFSQLLGIRKNGEILLRKGCRKIFLYNPVNITFRKIRIAGEPCAFESYTYVESLISPGSGMAQMGNEQRGMEIKGLIIKG